MKSEQEPGKAGRRQHDRAFKEDLVRQSLEPGASVSAIALRHGINANMLFKWRREHLRAEIRPETVPAVLLPVELEPPTEVVTMPAPAAPVSFAAITDDPPEEVAAAGHDRCIVPIKPENVDAWLQPDPSNLDAQDAILDDRERPYYEHRLAA